ncbi:hypothetical protein HFO56_01515 [Rhizobium laguerreae]|uniref:hypothetical protein n=1 Tax=Rhizobium laguerreae TaxID=1076926 RepID=UPI001C91856C|nr:hypothetical protein [Rhizobium laguerreae]MBY3151088.1 hypothetical protein [Rhizobium laguerreae]
MFDLEWSLGRLNWLASKADGWKGLESVAMPSSVREATETFLREYDGIGCVMDLFVGLDADGDVTLFRKDQTLILDLSIGREGTYSFYGETPCGQDFQGETLGTTEPLRRELAELLIVSGSTRAYSAEQLQKTAN